MVELTEVLDWQTIGYDVVRVADHMLVYDVSGLPRFQFLISALLHAADAVCVFTSSDKTSAEWSRHLTLGRHPVVWVRADEQSVWPPPWPLHGSACANDPLAVLKAMEAAVAAAAASQLKGRK